MALRYRLGLDLGTNSLGWAILELDADGRPCRIERIGSRIFGDGRNPKDGSSKAVQRRGPRQLRRRRDRYLIRRKRYVEALTRAGLFPDDVAERQALLSLNPYRLRAEGLDRELTPSEFGRALFHLQQRRGFKSNRKTDKAAKEADKDPGKIKSAIEEFAGQLGGSTVGAALWRRIQNGQPARARLIGSGPTATYTFYVSREMVAQEFDALWEAQEKFSPGRFSASVRQELRDILLFQRDLLPQDVGRCFLERDELRAAVALPSSQLFRLYQEVNHLRLRSRKTLDERALNRVERDKLVTTLHREARRTLPKLREVLFGKAEARNWEFTLEDGKRNNLMGDQTSAKLSHAEAFGNDWFDFSLEVQDEIVTRLLDEDNERLLLEWLVDNHDVTQQQAEYISDISLPSEYLRLSTKAIGLILPHLIDGWDTENGLPLTYDKAVLAAGYQHHSDKRNPELLWELPYYGAVLGQYAMPAEKSRVEVERVHGKIGNPTVHIGLNQLRKIVNTLISVYGLPEQIVVELARDLNKSPEEKSEIKRDQKKNQAQNEAIRRELESLGQPATYDNRLRLRLFKELGATPLCIFSGRKVGLASLFSNEFQIDHILPISVTLDDGYANKVLVHHSANRYKANRSPYEAFGASADGYSWDDILSRSQVLPKNKQRRFSPEAMEENGERKDFLARQLNDTRYLSRVAKQYLEVVCGDVRVAPGRLTSMLRGKWNLNSILSDSEKKERTDHRHHSVDAAVVAVTDRSLLQRVSTAAARAENLDLDRTFDDFPEPWQTFREDLIAAVQKVVVSHKPDHGTGSSLHNETAYGIVSGPDASQKYRVRHRIPIEAVREKHLKDLQVSTAFRSELEDAILAASGESGVAEKLAELKEKSGRRSVRLVETLSVIGIYRRGESPLEGAEPYKAYKGDSNYCYEIFRTEGGKWDGRVVTSFEAQSKDYQAFMSSARFRKEAWSGDHLVMRVMGDDMIAIEVDGKRRLMRLQKLSPGQLALAEAYEANVDARTRDKEDSYRMTYKTPSSLKGVRARRVFVDPIGRLKDPGFRE